MWSVSSVQLPVNPSRVAVSNPARLEEFQVDGGASLAVCSGLGLRDLTVSGVLYEQGKTKEYLEDNYLLPLLALCGTEVSVNGLGDRADGSWILESVSWEEKPEGSAAKFTYVLRLKQGGSNIIL